MFPFMSAWQRPEFRYYVRETAIGENIINAVKLGDDTNAALGEIGMAWPRRLHDVYGSALEY
jgi:hypothetical protein